MRVRAVLAVGSALVMVAALMFATVTLSRPSKPTVPVQQSGTAAGFPHRTSAAVDLGRVENGRVVSGAGKRLPGPVAEGITSAREVPGAVGPAVKPKPLKFPIQGKTSEALRVLPAPAARKVQGYNPKTSRKLPLSGADQVTYANADGTKTSFTYTTPVNYRSRGGKWTPISTTLVPAAQVGTAASPAAPSTAAPSTAAPSTTAPSTTASAAPSPSAGSAPPSSAPYTRSSSSSPGWTEKSEAAPESFAGNAAAGNLVSVPVGGSDLVSFGISGAAPVTGVASGSTVTYNGARPDSSVVFAAGTGMVKESIVLASPSAPTTWVFPLSLKGLHAEMGPGGIVEFANSAGKVLAYVPRGFMTDSNVNPHSGDGVTSYGVTYSLVTAGGRQALQMTLDKTWLDSKSRGYPVTVDPSVSAVNANGSTYVQYPDNNDFSSDTELHIGTYDGGSDYAKSFIAFGNVASQLQNDTVLGAWLGLFNTWSYSCSPRAMYVYPVTSSWSVSGDKSWPGPSTGAAIGRASFATGWVPLGSTQSPCPASWEHIGLDQAGTNLVNGWTHGTIADNGLAIGASDSDSYSWKQFWSAANSEAQPFLSVTYTTDGASYALASRRPVTEVTPSQNGKIAVEVTNTGSSTWTTSNGYELSYRAYNSRGTLVANHPVFTPMPSTVAPGQTVTVDATVDSLTAGSYVIDFDMYSGATGSSPVSFSSNYIPPFPIGLYVPEPPPVVSDVYPPTGYVSPTLQQQLSTSATDTGTLTYDFTMTCEPLTGQTCVDSSVTSGTISKPYWTPSAADLDWNTPYQWQVVVTATSGSVSTKTTISGVDIEAEVPQPAITSNIGGSSPTAYDPLSGNYTTSATDAAVKSVGPALEIDRTYNSLNPVTSGAFGAGWSSVIDTSLRNDGSTVLISQADGQQMRFGENGDGSYAAPMGNPDALVKSSSGTWTLRDPTGTKYAFTSAGLISSITDVNGYAQDYTYNSSNQVTTITDAISGRALTLTWSTPTGAKYAHVSSVTTPAPVTGGTGYTWTYSYTGDELAQVCAPAVSGSGCTSYTYGSGSHYMPGVLDGGPRDYWQLGEASGSTTAADEVDVNLGTTDGTYNNVTLGAAGPLADSGETAASFNGTSSYVSLPNDLITDSTDVSVGLWFKAASSTTSGVLFAYQSAPLSASNSGDHEPALYIGGNGELYGEFWNGSVDPIHTSASVDDGKWHYAVLTASSNTQSLYLDGAQVGSALSGQIDQLNNNLDLVGAGFWNGGWTEATEGGKSTAAGYFDGDIGQVAVYPQPLAGATIASQYALAAAASPELTQVTLPSGNTYESVSYDSATGRVATYTDPNGGEWTISSPIATGYRPTADSLGQVIDTVTVSDPAGRQETYEYDMLDGGRPVSYGNGVDPPEDYGYDAAGFLTSVVDADGNLTCFTNDIHGNMLTRTWYPAEPASLPGGGVGANPSACDGSTASSANCPTSGAPCTTFYGYSTYDTANPLDPSNDELTSVRDGRSASATDDTYETTYSYNTIGQLISETTPATSDFPSGRTTRYAYSTGTETAANGGTIPAGLLESVTTPGGAVTSYSYDSNGDLAKTTEPSGRYTTYTYDALGRPQTSTVYTSTYPSGETTTYSYTPTGQPATVTYPAVTNPVTNVTHQLEDTYTYDADNNVLTQTQSDVSGGDATRTTTYTYNDHDEVATVTQPAGATTGGSSQANGAASANPDGATTGYDYDAFGNVTQVIDPNGNQYRYTYNEYNEKTQEILYTPDTNAATSAATCSSPATQDADGGCDLVLDAYTYDPAGLLAATTDAMGRITNYVYDHDQELIESSTTQACSASAPCTSMEPCTPTAQCTSGSVGTMTVYTYDGAGNLVSEATSATDGGAAGTTTTTDYNYDAADRLTSEVDDATPAGASSSSGYLNRTTAYTYDADNDVLSKTTGTGSALDVTDYGYDTAGDMTSQTVQDGSTSLETTWTYDQNGQPLSMTTPAGNVSGATAADYTTNYTYDPNGNLVTETGPPVSVSTYSSQGPATTRPVATYGYDTFGDQTQVVDPDGNETVTAYDGDGRKTSVTQPSYTPPGASSAITATTQYAYDEDGNLVSVKDPEGNVTSYTYDALGDQTSVTDPQLPGQSAAGTWTYTYDADGEQLSAKDPLGNQTQQTYDYFGNVASSTDALSNTTKYAYDYLGDQTMTDTPDGSVTTSTYDHLGELASVTDGAGDESTYDYDDQGNLAYAYNPDGSFAQYGYDEAGNQTSVTDYAAAPAGQASAQLRSESFGYDPDGDQTSVKDWDGNTTTYAYNAAGELTSQVQPVSSSSSITTSYGYDAAGNRTSVTDGNGNTTWTTYNSWNLPESVIEPTTATATSASDTTWTTAYNADGEPATVTEPGGVSLAYGYDPLGDITSESGTGATASTPDRSFTYDMDQRMTSAASGVGTDDFAYNADSDLANTSGPSGTSSYTYNNDGLVASETDAAGTTSYTYDSADRLSTEADPLTGSTMTWAYNSDSNPTSISYATNGTAGPVQSFGYDDLQRETSDTLTSASGSVLASETYGYDNNGNITSQTTGGDLPNASYTYTYDEANRLISATSGGTTTNYAYDGDGNLTQDGSTTNTYNAQDQLTSSTSPTGTTNYSYTLNGELASVTPPSGSAQDYTWDAYGDLASADGVSYGYDALGRLVTRTPASGTATSLSYVGTSASLASDGTSDYTYTPSGQITSAGQSGGTAYSTMTDQHGDVVGTFSPAASTTALAGSASYSPYGTVTATSGTMPAVGYQGDYTDPVTGLVYMNARWYNPANGTFVSNDTLNGSPIPSTVNGNPYAYVDGNPLTNTDPTGHGCGIKCLACFGFLSVCALYEAVWGGSNSLLNAQLNGCDVLSCAPPAPFHCAVYTWTGCANPGPPPPNPSPPAPNPTQQPPQGCGWKCAVGIGIAVGVAFCAENPEICAAPVEAPPPPPPPPQNCYAAGTCEPRNASKAFKDESHITESEPKDARNPEHVPGDRIVDEKTPTAKEDTNGLKTSQGDTAGNDASGQNGSGGDGNPSTDGPHSPEPSGTGDGSAPSGSGDTPGSADNTPSTGPAKPSTPDTSSPGTGDSSGDGSGGNQNPGDQSEDPSEDDSWVQKLKEKWRPILLNAGLGAAGGDISDAYDRETDWVTYLKDAGIGAVTEAAGGLGDKWASTIAIDVAGAFADSIGSQAADNHGVIDWNRVWSETALAGLTGGAGYLSKLIGPLVAKFGESTAYNIVYSLIDAGGGSCDYYTDNVEHKGC
jgi:RHS repeat-associated protein